MIGGVEDSSVMTPPRWEYKVGHFSGTDLRDLGKQGWELVTVICRPNESLRPDVYLKRRLSDPESPLPPHGVQP